MVRTRRFIIGSCSAAVRAALRWAVRWCFAPQVLSIATGRPLSRCTVAVRRALVPVFDWCPLRARENPNARAPTTTPMARRSTPTASTRFSDPAVRSRFSTARTVLHRLASPRSGGSLPLQAFQSIEVPGKGIFASRLHVSERRLRRRSGARGRARRKRVACGRRLDHATNEPAAADTDTRKHVLAVVAAHVSRGSKPVVGRPLGQAPDLHLGPPRRPS